MPPAYRWHRDPAKTGIGLGEGALSGGDRWTAQDARRMRRQMVFPNMLAFRALKRMLDVADTNETEAIRQLGEGN